MAGRSRTNCAMRLLSLLLLLILPAVAQAQFNYTVNNGTVIITEYTGPGGDVVIPGTIEGLPVTSIGCAFEGCTSLTSVTIPDSVNSIWSFTFHGCTGLTSVTIPNSVTSIGYYAFEGCTGLSSITIPDSVTSIEQSTFRDCTRLTSVTIPDSVTKIEMAAFWGCTGLINVTIGNGVASIGSHAFRDCTSLTSVTIPDSVTNIEWMAFYGCTKLSLKISSGVMSISGWNLANVGRLAAIEVDSLNPFYSSVGGVLYDKNQTTVILCPRGIVGSVTVPSSVTSIAGEAFKDCGLQVVYFLGDAPAHADDAFANTPATLFYVAGSSGWESTLAGRPTVSWSGLFGAQSLEMYAGLTIIGEVGKVYSIKYVTDLTDPADSDWRCLEYLRLPASPYLWADKSAPATGKRFYRAVAMEPPENMVFIPPGTFRMGSPETEVDRWSWEVPQTAVTISRGFWMGKYEVTQGEYLEVMGNNPSWFNAVRLEWWDEKEIDYGTDLTRPVEQVSWDDAVAYCAALTERERLAGRIAPNSVYRLPTEAEWEYACRGWTSTQFSYGDDPEYTNLTNYAWYYHNSDWQTHPVGQKLPNPWGLYDMHGNVWEWCQDWFSEYSGGVAVDPQGPDTGSYRVIRSGYWGYWNDCVNARHCWSAYRLRDLPDHGDYAIIGFRSVPAPGQP
jgi:formylglycine-generating enzyme required for sulfatase activity